MLSSLRGQQMPCKSCPTLILDACKPQPHNPFHHDTTRRNHEHASAHISLRSTHPWPTESKIYKMPYDAAPDLRDLCLSLGLSPSIIRHSLKTNTYTRAAAPQTQRDELDFETHRILGQVEGDRLTQWISVQLAMGSSISPINHAMVKEFANRILDAQGAPRDTFGDAWIHRLLQGGQPPASLQPSTLAPPSGPIDDEPPPRQPMTKALLRAYIRDLTNPRHSLLIKRLLIKLIEKGFHETDLYSDWQVRKLMAAARTKAKAKEGAASTKSKKGTSRTKTKEGVARARSKKDAARIRKGAVLPEPGCLFVTMKQIRRAMVEAGRIPAEEE